MNRQTKTLVLTFLLPLTERLPVFCSRWTNRIPEDFSKVRHAFTLLNLRQSERIDSPDTDEAGVREGVCAPPPSDSAFSRLVRYSVDIKYDYNNLAIQLIGEALIRRMVRLGLLKDNERKLDYVLGLTTSQFLERRLQTLVQKRNLAQSIHHARVLIFQKHIAVGKQTVNIPSYMVRVSSEQHIQRSATSVFKTGKAGRMKRKRAQGGGGDD